MGHWRERRSRSGQQGTLQDLRTKEKLLSLIVNAGRALGEYKTDVCHNYSIKRMILEMLCQRKYSFGLAL